MKTWLMKKKVVIASVIALLLATSALTVIASNSVSRRELSVITRDLLSGWNVRDRRGGIYLSQGRSYYFSTTLFRGSDYLIVGAGDRSVRDLDIELYDEYWNPIDDDNDRDSTPVVQVTPRWTGTFYVVVRMYSGSGYSNVAICYR